MVSYHKAQKKTKTIGSSIDAEYEVFDVARDQNKLAGYLRKKRAKRKSMELKYSFGTTVTQSLRTSPWRRRDGPANGV